MEWRAIRPCRDDARGISHPCPMCRRGHPHGQNQGKDEETGLDTGRRYPDRYSLEFPGRKVWHHLPILKATDWLVAKKPPYPIKNHFLFWSCCKNPESSRIAYGKWRWIHERTYQYYTRTIEQNHASKSFPKRMMLPWVRWDKVRKGSHPLLRSY